MSLDSLSARTRGRCARQLRKLWSVLAACALAAALVPEAAWGLEAQPASGPGAPSSAASSLSPAPPEGHQPPAAAETPTAPPEAPSAAAETPTAPPEAPSPPAADKAPATPPPAADKEPSASRPSQTPPPPSPSPSGPDSKADAAPEGARASSLSASVQVIGSDAHGQPQVWAPSASYALDASATAADLSERLFSDAGLRADYSVGSYGWYLSTITSPFDPGQTLGYDPATGAFWQLFVNGAPAQLGAGSIKLADGDQVLWYYSAAGQPVPDPGGGLIVPDAPRPSYASFWPSFGRGAAGGAVVKASTPTQPAPALWQRSLRDRWGAVSDPLVVNGDLYLVSIDRLLKIDAGSGAVKASRGIGGSVQSFCRPAYADGLIIVPTDDASLAAYTADTLTCVWRTPLPSPGTRSYQALSSLTVSRGRVYAGFTEPDAAGALMCVRVSDGALLWSSLSAAGPGKGAGYYWAGAAPSGDDVVIGDDSGSVQLIEGGTGKVKSSLALEGKVRAGVVALPDDPQAFLAVTNDGVVHKLSRRGDALEEEASLKFASGSTSTPTVFEGRAFVGGWDAAGAPGSNGTLSVLDTAQMKLQQTVGGLPGEVKSTPLVSARDGEVYAYFTCNARPGGVFSYRLGDQAAAPLFEPGEDASKNYSTASAVADESGNLFFTNDSGYLFALKAQPSLRVSFNSNGGSPLEGASVAPGARVARPPDPSRAGFSFGGWYLDAAGTRAWDFSNPVQAPLELWAAWTPLKKQDEQTGEEGVPARPAAVSPGEDPPPSPGGDRGAAAREGGSPAEKRAAEAPEAEGGAASSARGAPLGLDGAGSAPGEDEGGRPSNPWAVAGVAAGCAGLAIAAGLGVYAWRRRRRSGADRQGRG